jgi:ATP synthase subunit 6
MQEDSQALEQHGHWLNVAKPYIPHWAEGYIDPVVLTVWVVLAALILLAYLGGRHLRQVPGPMQNAWEFFVETIQGFCRQIIGPGGDRYAPFIGSIFLYVFCNAAIGLVPGFVAPASSLNTTLAPALTVFFAVQYFGFREHGIRYIKHFTGDIWWLAPLMFVLHLIGEIARPLTLSLRRCVACYLAADTAASTISVFGPVHRVHTGTDFHHAHFGIHFIGSWT